MASTYLLPKHEKNEYDFDDNDSVDLDDEILNEPASDEDTEDASETDVAKQEEFTEIKEQMYQQKLAQLKKQLQHLKEGTLPEYMKKLKRLDQHYKERLRINEIWYHYQLDETEREYVKEKKSSVKEFEEKKIDLKEQLIIELEERKKNVECERTSMELTGDSMELKPVTTRKLRRRPNDPTPVPEKRRKPSPAQLNFFLDEEEIMEDLRIINKVSGKPLHRKPQTQTGPSTSSSTTLLNNASSNPEIIYDARIDDGRLYYDKKWFHRGQAVYVESKETGKVSAVISAVGTQEIWLRRTSDNGKLRVYVTQLQKGKYSLRRRTFT